MTKGKTVRPKAKKKKKAAKQLASAADNNPGEAVRIARRVMSRYRTALKRLAK